MKVLKPIRQLLRVGILVGMMGMGCLSLHAQGGLWTWMNGANIYDQLPTYGIKGIPSILNTPAATYAPTQWKDKQGNFWIYGGNFDEYSDLWKYNPLTNEWTWMNGTGLGSVPAYYGIKGVADSLNTPGFRAYGAISWVDTSGNLWLYGGFSLFPDSTGLSNLVGWGSDLWKYDIQTNLWTWINGFNVATLNTHIGPYYYKYPEINHPGSHDESNASWVDSDNNLWMYGGDNIDSNGVWGMGDAMWKYNIASDQWTLMKGHVTLNHSPVYGIKGVPHPNNTPGSRCVYTKWKDEHGNFWIFGGAKEFNKYQYADVWKYYTVANMWVWMSGPDTLNSLGSYGTKCSPSPTLCPHSRYEDRACWVDIYNCFWLLGGFYADTISSIFKIYADLWVFNPKTLNWTKVSGNAAGSVQPNYGIQGVTTASNFVGGRGGAAGWCDTLNTFWVFGGNNSLNSGGGLYNDVWKFEPDTSCYHPISFNNPITYFTASDTTFCEKHCIDFYDLSTNNPTSWQWFFPGADSTTSTLQNPTNICYSTYGSFDVTLIACNAAGCDTLVYYNFINEYPAPIPVITQSNDTLFSSPGNAYQWWSVSGGIIAGANNYYYIPTQAGDYYVMVTDSIGCEGASNTIIITGVNQISNFQFPISIIPNPNDGSFTVTLNQPMKDFTLRIIDPLGQTVYKKQEARGKGQNAIVVSMGTVAKGIYAVELITDEKVYRQKFLKE